MQPDKVDQMLRNYKIFLGRCKYLTALLDELRADAQLWRENLADDYVHVTSNHGDMPHGSGISNPTETVGILLADGNVPPDLTALESQICEYEKELRDKSTAVRFVDAWLEGLTEKESWIVQEQVICGEYWREIVSGYRRKFGEEYSKEGLKRIRDLAMMKIHKMAA